ncbi:uncharacterized protein LOC141851431 [Brevipalpus obovatus]|uniref:uncharacterized protein LOC141851431 n=1 Tax=Brevipalpus obovatus TaxID=246614 RepID=UPI003D9E8423
MVTNILPTRTLPLFRVFNRPLGILIICAIFIALTLINSESFYQWRMYSRFYDQTTHPHSSKLSENSTPEHLLAHLDTEKQSMESQIQAELSKPKMCLGPVNILPDDSEIVKSYKNNVQNLSCERKNLLTHMDSVSGIVKPVDNHISCEYSFVTISPKSDRYIVTTKPKKLPFSGVQLTEDQDTMNVTCYDSSKHRKAIYRNTHLFVPNFEPRKCQNNNGEPCTSVFILVIESMSRLSFERFMKKTGQVLDKYDFIRFRGHNVVGRNSFPNSLGLLTGSGPLECLGLSDHNWPFIWEEYQRYGYVTAFHEDMAIIGLFNYACVGFREKQSDFNPRPFWLHIYPGFPSTKSMYNSFNNLSEYCFQKVGSKIELFLNQSAEFMRKAKASGNYFLDYSFYSQVTHEDFNNFKLLDPYVASFYEQNFHLFDDSIVLLIGDHGSNYGDYWYTVRGRLESRMPFFSIRLPKHLQDRHPHLKKMLQSNTDRLTSWFDVHKMLLDVVHGNYEYVPHWTDHREVPLFRTIVPADRTCSSADIPADYCTCNGTIGIQKEWETGTTISKMIVSEVNKILKHHSCSPIDFGKLIHVGALIPFNATTLDRYPQLKVTFSTIPHKAQIYGLVISTDGYYTWKLDENPSVFKHRMLSNPKILKSCGPRIRAALSSLYMPIFLNGSKNASSFNFESIMKPPKLPGAEKFKFWRDVDSECSVPSDDMIECGLTLVDARQHLLLTGTLARTTCSVISSSSSSSSSSTGSTKSCSNTLNNRRRIYYDDDSSADYSTSSSSSSSSSSSTTSSLHRLHLKNQSSSGPRSLDSLQSEYARRKVILPITSRLTAKVLALTDLPLDSFVIKDYNRCSRLREKSIAAGLLAASINDTSVGGGGKTSVVGSGVGDDGVGGGHRVINVVSTTTTGTGSITSSNTSLSSSGNDLSGDYHDMDSDQISSSSNMSTLSFSSSSSASSPSPSSSSCISS